MWEYFWKRLQTFFFVKLPFYFLISFLKNQSFIFMTLYVQKNRHAGDDTFSKTNFALAIWLLCYRSTVSVRHWKYFFFQVVFGLVNNYETNKFCFVFLLHSHPLQWNTDKYFSQRGRGVLFWSTWKMRTDVERHCVPITEKSVMEI